MTQITEKLNRIRRLHAVESAKLNVRVAALVTAEARVNEQMETLRDLQSQRDEALVGVQTNTLDQLQQAGHWMESLSKSMERTRETLRNATEVRDGARAEMLAQRVKVRGLEKLIERLCAEGDAIQQAADNIAADEQALQKFARN
jgi:flagellar biosynthesis chaperone FliJ